MVRGLIITALLVSIVLLVGCATVPLEKYEATVGEKAKLEIERDSLQRRVDELENEKEASQEKEYALQAKVEKLEDEQKEDSKEPPGTEYVEGGKYFKHGRDGKLMVWIPGGEFMMGSYKGESNEAPPHRVRIDGFWMDTTEVANAEYKKFVDATGHRSWEWDYPSDKASHPVILVNWLDATAYCKWAGKRLSTEAEWEYAAGGPNHYKWSLGDEFDKNGYHYWDYDGPKKNLRADMVAGRGTMPVRSFRANGYGLHDMSGNVWEWTSSLYMLYPYDASHESDTDFHSNRVLRGGSWKDFGSYYLRTAPRYGHPPTFGNDDYGFRCAE